MDSLARVKTAAGQDWQLDQRLRSLPAGHSPVEVILSYKAAAARTPRMQSTNELHCRFVKAVDQLVSLAERDCCRCKHQEACCSILSGARH